MPQQVLSTDTVADRLTSLPAWRAIDGTLQRRIKTQNFKASLMLATTIGHLCEVAWHHPELGVTFNTVTVKLWTHSAGGITAKDFALAAKIEDLLSWQPGAQGGVLSGTPRDPRHAYLLPDEPQGESGPG